MINYYQPFLLPFLGTKKSMVPHGIKRFYYHSFEDALWDFLDKKGVAKGSTILVPSFYCMDVVDNIKLHGYTPQFYPVDKNFQIIEQKLNRIINTSKPAVLILFHACGIKNSLVTKAFISRKKNIFIIEDSVHRLVDPAWVRIFGPNHFLIDSLRKVTPLPGSFIYGTTANLSYAPAPTKIWNSYYVSSFYWFIIFRILVITAAVTNNASLASLAHTKHLKHHDDIIGDSHAPQRSLSFIGNITLWINYQKIRSRKSHQTELYQKLTKNLFANRSIYYPIKIPKDDYPSLHVFPLGLTRVPEHFIETLHQKRLAVWCKYEDSPWASNQHVLFLPLGFHVSDAEIRYIIASLVLFQAR